MDDQSKYHLANRLIMIALLLASVIHLLPVSGVLGADQLTRLYGLPFEDTNLQILMRHRAVLFGLLGVFLAYAAFKRRYQTIALTAGVVSTLSFIVICFQAGDVSEAIQQVFIADVVALASLILASTLYVVSIRGK